MNLKRVIRLVNGTEADAWIVMAASREILEWFSHQEKPAFALFGRRGGLLIAGVAPDKLPAMITATRALTGMGHRRIVLLVRTRRRLPESGRLEQAFLDELAAQGIEPGSYHLPHWEESASGFHARLDSLFQMTPPTALILDEEPLFVAALQFCASRGISMCGMCQRSASMPSHLLHGTLLVVRRG